MRRNVIVISGTPGVGKTAVAKELAKRLNAIYVNLTELVLEKKLYVGYDSERDSYVIDEDKVKKEILKISKRNPDKCIIIDSHYGELTPREVLVRIFILRCDPRTLAQRLKRKGWKKEKIRENVQAEILGVCTVNALKEYEVNLVYEIDNTNRQVEEVVNEIINVLRSRNKEKPSFIDWLTILTPDELADYI